MHAAPAVDLAVTRFGAWRTAVAATGSLAALVVGAWLVSQWLARGEPPTVAVAAVGFVALAGGARLVWGLWHVPAFGLRWDGRAWHLALAGPVAVTAADPVAGDVAVALDLGHWLLLRFTPERPGIAPPLRWLPLQRRGLEAQWHALRCAVHSPRPPATSAATVAE